MTLREIADAEGGPMFIRETIKVLDAMKLSDEDRAKIYYKNGLRLMKMPDGT